MFKQFIKKPVLSSVISIIILILGVIGISTLPMSQYPDIAPPTVRVSASYDGANAEAVLNSVIVPLEEAINGVEGMTYMTSTASSGAASISVYFALGTDPDIAAVNVQNAVSTATSVLPSEVTQAGVTTEKSQSSNVLIIGLYSENDDYDEEFVQNYANINLIPTLKRIDGVGSAEAFGSRDYSMRIWLKANIMANYGLEPSDISTALADQNLEAAPGELGLQGDQAYQYTLKYKGKLQNASEFEDIIIKTTDDGRILRLKDVARVELGAQSYSSSTMINGRPGVGVAIAQSAGSNAQEIVENAIATLEAAAVNFPEGLRYTEMLNANDFLEASITKVIHTLIEAFLLVFLVVFIFLQDWRSTLIPAISVPVAIVGTFFFLNIFGFTINLLTLFALMLAIGIVVDDAIVVVEAVHAKLDSGYTSSRKASLDAMSEISGAIISITLVMSAVFIPVTFISGSSGVFYQQFGITLAIAIILSAINALTLSPALCAILLKPHDEHAKKSFLDRFYIAFNVGFEKTTSKYKKSVSFLIKRKPVAIGALLVFIGLFVYLMNTTATGFVPDEDQGTIMADISLPASASLERTAEVVEQLQELVQDMPEVSNVLRSTGRGMISGEGSNYGMIILKLKDWSERTGDDQDVQSIIKRLFAKTADFKDARIIFFAPPTITGFGMSNGFQLQLQDQSGGTVDELYKVSQDLIAALSERPEIQYANTTFDPTFPQYEVVVDVAKTKLAGLDVEGVLSVMQGYFSGVYASNFNKFGKQYRVIYQAEANFRDNLESLNAIKVKNGDGVMAPITEFVTLKRVYGPQSLTRFNLFTAASIMGAPNDGYSSGDAIAVIDEVAKEVLPIGYGYEYSGMTREEISAGSQTVYIFMLCFIFVYFLLCAQYESYILPIAVLLAVPAGLSGVLIFANLFGISNNIYIQITLVMLIGLLAKNAILIIEFAIQRRREGETIVQSAIDGAIARFRPILMTSFAFIFGLLPLMIATGAGATGNRAIGTGAIGGMLIGTILGVLIIPVLFVVFQTLQERIVGVHDHDWGDEDDEKLHLNK
ncbi:efflux RND transporter permease subunit [Formosa algae]|uniref:HAE1 family hydrophobic/amphiphilic exporter-1 n=1 Tax=Formosa algae TaxID=225843 RepID=A0A9X0YQ43_9FLAO|nr:efflux RND transporter permease subunit [Formosa algae]MBP1840953.1 HAE1 family hydrophobic/amphiphilic exporter-1 [Formosa algae]MDQ0336150.1 HAE1 family hydrophobic/amphiphilic exporter-1 [Formosa algae]OEI79932.1 multidrug transporter AcrB [Formosa algae]